MNLDARKRISQKTITDMYAKGGAAAVRVLLAKFPGGKQTFRKTIESLKALGKDCADLDALNADLFGSAKTFITSYDAAVLGSPEEIAAENGIPQNQVYIIARERNIEPDCYVREENAKGKGTALYNRAEIKAEIEAYFDAKREQYRETFDAATEVTTDLVADLVQSTLGLDAPVVSPLLKLFNVQPLPGKLREAGGRGKGTNLYRRSEVEQVLRVVLANRLAGAAPTEADTDAQVSVSADEGVDAVDVSLISTEGDSEPANDIGPNEFPPAPGVSFDESAAA